MATITPLTPGDTTTVRRVFAGMSAESRYRRFHGHVAELLPPVLERLTAVDGRDHVAVVATLGRGRRARPVGLARLVRTGPATAEFAVEVVDAAQGRGIGRRLVAWARAVAPTLGVDVVVAEVLSENGPMRRLITDEFPGATCVSDGRVLTYRCRVGESAWTIEAADLVGAMAVA